MHDSKEFLMHHISKTSLTNTWYSKQDMQLRVFCKFTALSRSTFHDFFSKGKQPQNL